MKKLLERKEHFDPKGVVRSDKSKSQLKGYGATDEQIFVGDILDEGGQAVLEKAVQNCHAMVICTSAVPQINYLSLIKVFWGKLTKQQGVRPDFTFKSGQMPEKIDWIGQKLQIDAAKKAGVKHCILVSSMGGTQRDNALNSIGNGDILVWKRRSEKYLVDSGIDYTIIHPGGLTDDAGGNRDLIVDVDDVLIKDGSKFRRIPRDDVAELCVQCLSIPEARNKSFDVVSKNPEDAPPTKDFKSLLLSLSGKTCDYSDMDNDVVLKNV